jgi:hypothetical protein
LEQLTRPLPSRLTQELQPGETILWSARPIPIPMPVTAVLPIVLGLFAFGLIDVAILWIMNRQMPEITGRMAALVAIGLPALGGVLWFWSRHNLRQSASRTGYAVTDRRVLILDSGFCGRSITSLIGARDRLPLNANQGVFMNAASLMQSLNISPHHATLWVLMPDECNPIPCREREDGSGDLVLKSVKVKDDEGNLVDSNIGFFSVPDVHVAEAAVRALVQAHQADTEPAAKPEGGV